MSPRKRKISNLDLLKSENEVLKAENKELKEKARFIMCIWCGEIIDAGVDPEDAEDDPEVMQKVVDSCRDHDKNCLLNPLNKEIEELKNKLKNINKE